MINEVSESVKKKRNMLILCGQLSEVSLKELLLHFLTVEKERLVFQFVSILFCWSVHKINREKMGKHSSNLNSAVSFPGRVPLSV